MSKLKNALISAITLGCQSSENVYLMLKDDKLAIWGNAANLMDLYKSHGYNPLKEINCMDEEFPCDERSEEIIECYYSDDELEALDEEYDF